MSAENGRWIKWYGIGPDHPLIVKHSSAGLHLWVHLLFQASHKDNGILRRGQLRCGIRGLEEDTGIPNSTVSRILHTLATEGMIVGRKMGRHGTVITICNYDRYQGGPESVGRAVGQQWGSSGASTRSKEVKNTPPTPSSKNGRGKVTWLTPYFDAWTQRWGSKPKGVGAWTRPLKAAEEEHGPERVHRAWSNYLTDLQAPQYLNVHNFASAVPHWLNRRESHGPQYDAL